MSLKQHTDREHFIEYEYYQYVLKYTLLRVRQYSYSYFIYIRIEKQIFNSKKLSYCAKLVPQLK